MVAVLVMKMYKFDDQRIIEVLGSMPLAASVAFSAACASRLARGYEAAQEYLGDGDPKILSRALDALWHFASGGEGADWEPVVSELVEAIPDEAMGRSFAHAVVDDALAATAYAARVALKADARDAVWSAQRAYDTVDRFAGLKLNENAISEATESALLGQHVVQVELQRQARDLAVLELASPETLSDAVAALRSRGESALPIEDLKDCMAG